MLSSAKSTGVFRHNESTSFIWMVIDRARCINVLSCLLLCATLTGRYRSCTPFVCSEGNRPIPVWRQLSLTCAGPGKLNPGGIGVTSFTNLWSQKVFSRHSMLHFYFAQHATLVPDWAGSGLSAALLQLAQMGVLIYVAATVHGVEIGAFYLGDVLAPVRSKLKTVRLLAAKLGWLPAKIKRLSVDVGQRHPVTICKASLVGL